MSTDRLSNSTVARIVDAAAADSRSLPPQLTNKTVRQLAAVRIDDLNDCLKLAKAPIYEATMAWLETRKGLTISVHGFGAISLRYEKRTQPKTGTRCPLSDLWCQVGREVQAEHWSIPQRVASRPPIDRSRIEPRPTTLATQCLRPLPEND
jgi:hypothetical protein